MNKKELHNLTRNRIKTVFKAKQRDTLVFNSVYLSLQLTFVVVALALVVVFSTNKADSNRAQDVLFGVEQTTNIFPTKVSATGWTSVEGVFVQDLPDYALYQEFSKDNSAQLPNGYIDKDVEEMQIDAAPPSNDETPASSDSDGEVESDSQTTSPEAVDEPTPSEPEPAQETEPEPEPEPTPEPVVFNYLEKLLVSVKNQATGLYPLAQLTLTSSTEPTVGVEEPIIEETPEEEVLPEEEVQTVEEIPEDIPGAYDMTLSGFDIADFDDGQFVDGMQLRISFGARTKDENPSVVPYVEVLFGDDDSLQSVGSILIDEEASNAINGGYYLFTLPSFIPVEELADSKVVLRYMGSNEELEGMYLDAAWLEMNTRVLSQEDLHERGVAEQLTHLEAPKLSVLLSDQLNFDRTETPVFNLRYEPQQNVILRGLRKLFGQTSFEVDAISVNHKAIGHIDVEPEVTVASDGLVTIELPSDQTKDLPPGTYEINILFNENGTEYTDTFNFQWGILTINPNKTEYEVGELADISLGALSPNGNTLCEAELSLYVTNPEGFIAKVPVTPSGECNGNNVIDVPDYTAQIPVELAGDYQLYLERVDETGALIGFTTDSFKSLATQAISIERNGPTRIYPKATYPMELTVAVDDSFDGVLKERVPASFVISSTTADITQDGDWQILSWNIDISGAGSQTVAYGFDAPDISPYLYNLGAASLEGEVSRTNEVVREVQTETGSSTDGTITYATSTVTEQETSRSNETVFEEHRQWQIASDAVGSLIIMWDGPTVPAGWTCISCAPADVFYQRFIVGSSTAGINGGAATHTHTASAAVAATTGNVTVGVGGGNNYNTTGHTHTLTPTIGIANNLPSYRNLVILQHNSAGEPTSVPAGAIVTFDATVPTGWTQYSAQNGFYVRGESIANRTLTGGSNTHTHTIGGTTGAGAGANNSTGGGTVNLSNVAHTHTITSNTAAANSEPPYIQMILGKLNATSTMPNNAIGMWSEDAPTDWNVVSGPSGALQNRFFKPAATYGTTGGSTTETPGNVTGIISGVPSSVSGATRGGAGTTRPSSVHTHSVNVTGFSTANILPPFRSAVFAKRAGGQPPAAPVIHELFDQEKTGTSTPEFEFTADDSVGTDTLVYQFQWDTDSDLDTARIGDRVSDDETGCSPNCFENTVNGGDTNPFNENERIRFTIQDPLTDGTTYYYRVRAKKTTGTTWGTWSNVSTFTYVADTDPSQWLQTVDTQFSTGVFTGTEVFGSDSVRIASAALDEVLVAYGEGVVTTPRYRIWDGTAWSAEASAQSVGGTVEWVKTAASPIRDEYILGVQDAVSDVNVQIFNGTTDTWGNLVEVITTIGDITRRGFDVAYETTSGDALIVYCNGTDAAYRVWNGTAWSGQTTITTASANACHYITLTSDPVSDEIIMVTRDNSAGTTDYEALVWSGSAWGNSITGGTITDANNEGIAVEYEESGGQAVVAISNGANSSFLWTSWNGTEWSTIATQALGDDFQWGVLKSDAGSDSMALCYIDTDDDIGIVRWNGESWAAAQEIDTGGNPDTGRAISCEFETTAGRDGYIMMPYSDTTNARYRFWNGTSFSAEASVTTILDSWEVGSVRAADGKILTTWHDDDTNTQYDFSYWNGTAWSSIQTLEGTPSVTANPRKSPIDMSARIYQFVQGSFTTDPVSFGLVPGRPTWGEASWTATEPAGTSVEIQVLYATTSACNVLVPDGALPGNSTGFVAADAPINLSSLSTSTYSSLCLRATLTSQSQNVPTLDDWTISWERQPFLAQSQFRWYANRNLETPNDVWPAGATDLLQNEAIPQAYSPGSGDILRLRMALRADNAPLAASSDAFKLQYSQTSGVCASSTVWADVGSVGSTTAPWRGYNNLLAFDGSTLGTLLLGSDVAGTYEEENDSDINPNTVALGNEVEYDWVLEHNGALDGAQYCFRMINDSGAELSSYEQIPSLITNASPLAPTLEKVFDNEQVASTSPWFEFSTTDPEGEDVSYQIQVDDSYDFTSTVLDRNSTTNLSEFENIVTPADKDAFTMGQTIRFKPSSALSSGTTYYWRVRGKDGTGSNDWGDWSTVYSFTVDTGTTVTTWYQTQTDQFNTNENTNAETTGSNDVVITPTFSVGTTTSTAIDFDGKTTGNAWGSLSWNNNLAAGTIRYAIEYLDEGTWTLVPDAFLPGNSAGFTTSPVSLLSLDPQIHNEIRVRAVMTDVGGSPRLLDWKIEWGFAVEQPTQISLFDNEKTGTTTPSFTFTTTDPDNDDIQYEFSWSTDSTFTTGVNVATSGVSAGFANVTTGADTSPFFSGDTISYRMQSALTNGTTYWWRVRGKDPFDGDAWSVWSPTRSFTVDTAVSVSTWFQTTDAQFQTDALNDTETTGSGGAEVASIIREAIVVYAEGTIQTPRYRVWNGSTWSIESSGVSVGGPIRFIETAATQVRNEYVVATQEGTGRVRAQVYDGTTDVFDDLHTVVAAVPGLTARGFDVAYESTSGDALVVACDGTEATYSVWNGTSWTSPAAITLAVTANCNWIELASDPTSDEIIMVARDAITGATDYQALVWSGSAWGNSMTMGSQAETNDAGLAVEYEESGTQAVVVVSNGANASFVWNSWNGSAWSGVGTQALQDDFENGRLSRDLGSDNMALCSIDQDGQIALVRWTGSSNTWNAFQTIEITGNSKVGRPSDCVFETTSGRDGYIMVPYSDGTNARYRVWDGTVLSGEASISTIQDSFEVKAIRTGDGSILSFFYDDVNTQYDFSYWDGVAWSTIQTLEATSITTTAPATIPISAVARRYPTFTEGSVVSSAIDFDEGSGLKWQSVSFNDTTPGSSEISYQIEYLNGDTWELIPNGALAGNSTGFTSSPIDISNVSRITYNTIRLKANLACISGNCPTLNDWTVTWSAGINVAGTIKQYDQTASTTSGTIAVAVNGVLQSGKTATVVNGAWSIPNVTAFAGDTVTTFVTGAANTVEAVGVTKYDGDGDITGIPLFERHLSLGSNDATSTPITNANIGSYDFTNTEDIFFNGNGNTLSMCADAGCFDAELYVKSGTYYTPGGRILTHDFENNGIFTAGSFTHEVNGSWDNNATTTMAGSTVVFAATSTTESIDNTGALSISFNNVTMGTTTGNGTWNLSSTFDVNGNLTVSRGTLARSTTQIFVAGNLSNESNGLWTGVGTTTFDGNSAATWRDQNGTLQNIGHTVIDGTSKIVTLASNVAAQSISIGANDTLDASTSNYDITVYGRWNNQNNFLARSGEVIFAAGSAGQIITTTGDAFYDLTFNGGGGGWAFTENTVQIGNDLRVAQGTVTLPSATTTIAGSFNATGGTFQNNNGTMLFTSGSPETLTFAGGTFTNVAYNLQFTGAGSWTVADVNATSTNNVRVTQGTLNFGSGVFAIGGLLADTGGVYNGGTGTVRFYSATAKVLTAGGSAFNNVTFDGAGSWSFTDTNVTVSRNLTVNQGTLALPSVAILIAGSYDNNATVVPGTGTVQFNSNDAGETIDFGASSLYNVVFNNATGGWTVVSNGTTTNALTLTAATSLTVNSGVTLSVGTTFTNSVGGTATTWTGSTLALRSGNYSLNTKANTGDSYGTLNVASNTDIKMWNSSSTNYAVNSSGSLYSQDHSAVDGDLHIFGSYERTTGNEHWSYATDFDGTALGGSSRQVDVRFASGASATFTSSSLQIVGTAGNVTTINGRSSSDYYGVVLSNATINAEYYDFSQLNTNGLVLNNGTIIDSLENGHFTLSAVGGTSITLSTTTIDANPALQIYDVTFDTTLGTTPGGSGEDTFEFFDDFADGSIDTGKWTKDIELGSITETSGYLRAGGGITTGNYGHTSLGSEIGYAGFLNNAVIWRARNATDAIGEMVFRGDYGTNRGYKGRFDQRTGVNGQSFLETPYATWTFSNGTGTCTSDSDEPVANTWYTYQITASSSNYKFYRDAVLKRDCTDSTTLVSGEIALQNHYGSYTDFDWVAVRKFVNPEPTHSTWGSEEEPTTGVFRKSHTIAGTTAGAQTDYVLPVTVNFGSGSDSGQTMYCGGDCNGDFSDVQFTDASGAPLDYWREESYVASTSATFWVKLNSIPASPGTTNMYVYYGNTTGFNVSVPGVTEAASYVWFRNHAGNHDGEAFDNDLGTNAGDVRWDDSPISVTISGTVYSDAGVTPITGGTCDGVTQSVRVVVNGGASYTGSCSNVDGSYSIPGISATGDPTVTIYLDNASGGQRGAVITRTIITDITDADIYASRVIVRHEGVDALTNVNMAVYDSTDDSDIRFTAAGALTVHAGNELYVWNNKTFTPGGTVTLLANAGANSYDGTLYVDDNAVFNAYASTTLTVGGRFVLDTAASFSAASTTVLMNATTSGKSITAPGTVTFNNLTFNGSGGTWNLGASIIANGNMTVTAGTVTGTGNISLPNGSLTGNGILSLGAGTTTIARSNTLGGTSAWTFYNLQLGNGSVVGTTTPVFTATTTVAGRLTIATAHFLDANATNWDLGGTGTVFVENGTFLEDTSTVRYSGTAANVRSTGYYNLDINAGAGSQTYTATGLGISVQNNLTVGGTGNATFNLTTNDPLFDVNGSVLIRTNGTFIASDTNIFTVAGNYTNDGTFTNSNGTITFDGTGTTAIAAGNSSFANVRVAASGAVTVTEHATTSTLFRLQSASSFTVTSGQSLAVGGTFFNALGGAATTWTGSTLRLYGNGNYSINAATTTDTYATLSVDGTTQIRAWNSDAGTYDIDATASLYSQDHANNAGDLYIWGSYRKTTGSDHWSYATDFDGTALGGSPRKVDVFMASGASVSVTGGSLAVVGSASASTTIQNQGSGTYGLLIGGNASSSFQYYEVTDANSSGLVLTGTPTINTLSFGDFLVSQNGGTAITVGGTVITQNPAKNFTRNRFALDGVGSGVNVTATGTSISAWRFANHSGDIDGEAFDVDPNGDPGYVAWDDSAALITVSGNVYSDEGTTASGVCDGVTNNVTVRVAGITSYSTTCNATTGAYSIGGISYGSADSIVVYIDGETEKGASITQDPITNITSFNIYENRVIVRHESTAPLTIDDMAVWDSSDDADIPFTAISGSPDTLTLPANRKLIVWGGKSFTPGGDVTIAGGGAGAAYDGTLELFSNAIWNGAGTEAISVGGSMILNTGADFNTSNGTTTFTTTGSARTIDLNQNPVHNVAFTGSGSWNITDATFTVNGNMRITSGTVDLPVGTSTFNGSFVNNGGVFDANNGVAFFNGGATHTVRMGGSNFATTTFSGGTYSITDASATSTGTVTIESGTLRLPSTRLTVGGNFTNSGGAILHNNSELVMRNAVAATLLASSSDLYGVTFAGGGNYTMLDEDITLLDSLLITNGAVDLASTTLAIGGSFDATGGTFNSGSTTILFNSSDTGEIINPGVSDFYAVQIGAPGGGYSLTGNATTTHNFSLLTATSFTAQSGTTLRVEGVFTNTVGGTATNWNGSTLVLAGENQYTINTKVAGADVYNNLRITANTDIRMWNSLATTTTVAASGSLYSQDHATVNGFLYIYGDFHIAAATEYWSYATDFDGTALGGSPRAVTVHHAANASTTLDGGGLNIVGITGNETTITNQGSGTYNMSVSAGTLNASYYRFRNLNSNGLTFVGGPTINSLSNGDFELAVNGGSLITVASTTLNANASLVFTGNRFATTTAITGNNVTLNGVTSNAWTFSGHVGNLDGEAYDDDGIDECGSIRWSDSECLITQQVHFRWRNDDGGTGVPDSEWYNASWDARKAVRVENLDASVYSNAVVQLFVDFDADMQADFEDLRFTSDNGTTIIPHWIGSSTDSTRAEVWVKVPSLPSEDTATVFMYYNNPTATSTSNMENTFVAADDFEDDDLSEYSGQTTLFNTGTAIAYDGTYGLDNAGDETNRASTGGIFRLDQTVSQGETFRFVQYVDTSAGSGDETCMKFGVQTPGTANDNYAVCLEQYGVDRITLARDVVDNDTSGVILASSTVTYATGWYEVEVEWGTDDSFVVSLYNDAGTLVTTFSDTDGTYTSGGIGMSYWFHYGGWDSVGSRPTLATEPTIRFGAEQGDGGATWKAALDTAASYDANDIARLRIAIENSGLPIVGQQLLLEYAAMGAAPSCEAVNPGDFDPVPVQASCGTSPVCMQSSALVTNGATIGDLLFGPNGTFAAGQLREDPSNISSSLNIGQDQYTEMEYVITPTVNTVDENLCFRVTNNGTPFDTYLSVAHMSFRFDPTISNVVLNGGNDISLLPGTTTRIYATTTATDLNGSNDLAYATTTFYRSGAAGGASCSPNNNDCYIASGAQCAYTDCSGTTCELSCYADIFFHADPTDLGSIYDGQEWFAFTEIEDFDNGYDFETSIGQLMNTLRAIDVNNAISYGSLAASSNTGSYNASTTVENLGNVEINLQVEGTDMTDGIGAEIPADKQKFATSTFTYGGCTTCLQLSSTTPVALDVDLSKPTTSMPPVSDAIYWGVEVPLGINSAPHQGINVFYPTS